MSTKAYIVPNSFIKIALMVTILLVTFHPYFQAGVPYTHDGENHLARFANFKQAVREKQIPPRFAPHLNNGYGYPVFNYNYPLPNLLALPFSVLKVPYTITFKVIMVAAVAFGLAAISSISKQLNVSFLGQLVAISTFGLNPYLVNAILVRGSIGEVLAISILPWLIVGVEKIKQQQLPLGSWAWFRISLVTTAFMLSHNVTVLFGVPLLVIYAVFRLGITVKYWRLFLSTFLIAGLLSLWFWLPALAEKSLVVLDKAGLSQEYSLHFPRFHQLLFSPLQFGFSVPGSVDSLSFNLGAAQWLILLMSSLLLIKHQSAAILTKTIPGLFLISVVAVAWILVILQLSVSAPIWQLIPLVRFIQFPWRLSLFLVAWLPLLWLFTYRAWARWAQVLLILLLVTQAVSTVRLSVTQFVNKANIEYELFGQSTTTKNENLPVSFRYLSIGDWQPRPKLAAGMGEVLVSKWSGSYRVYQLALQSEAVIIEPTMNFRGWESMVMENGVPRMVEYIDNDEIAGRLAYRLSPGRYEVITRFTQNTWARLLGNTASLISGLVVSILVFKKHFAGRHE